MKIVIIDDDKALCRSLQIQLETAGHEVFCAYAGAAGLARVEEDKPDLVFVDLKLPDISGLDVLRRIAESNCVAETVMITSVQDAKATIEAIRIGAFDYIRKPLDMDAVRLCIEKARRHFDQSQPGKTSVLSRTAAPPYEIIGADPKIIEILKQIALLAGNQVPVLIHGESGSGKELVARTIHETACPSEPFIAVNCSAISTTLLESELFGHVRGAFTGATSDSEGKLTAAGAGVLFLDEIGDMSRDLQAKLLRVLQEREFERVGGTASIPFRARVAAATHRDLPALVERGEFREDLYYRLAVTTIKVPPLRERRGDLPLLVDYILNRLNATLGKNVRKIEEKALQRIQAYDWPGNVRELINVLTRGTLLARDDTFTEQLLDAALEPATPGDACPGVIKPLRDVEKEHVERALHATGWNIMRTAELLGITRVTLRKKIGEYNLRRPRPSV